MKYYFPQFKKSSLIAFAIIVYLAYYLLLREDSISSISSITSHAHHTIKPHFLISALLPIYVGTMIFGAATLGLYLGARIENLFCYVLVRTHSSHKNRKNVKNYR